MTDLTARIATRMTRGAAWMVGLRWIMRLLGLVSTMILARLLVPDDFGLVAIASTVVAVIEIFGEFGFETYLIRHQDADRDDYDTAWTLNVIRGLVVAGCVVLLAPTAAEFFSEPRLQTALPWLSLAVIAFGFQNIGIVEFRKELQFNKEFYFQATIRLITIVFTIGLAVALRNYWALIGGIVFSKIFGLTLSYFVHSYRPKFTLSACPRLFHFSKWLLLNSILRFTYLKMDTFIIARLIGTTSLGFYSMAFEISKIATSELASPIRSVLLPGYSKLAGNREELRRVYLEVFGLTIAICTPIAAGIGLIAKPLVFVVLGEQWLDAVPLLQVLAICGVIRAFGASINSLFISIGKPHLNTMTLLPTLLLGLPTVYLTTSSFGTLGTAWAITGIALVRQLLNFTVAYFVLSISPSEYLSRAWRTAFAATLMALAILALKSAISFGELTFSAALVLILYIIVGALVYLSVHFGIWHLIGRPPGAEYLFLRFLSTLRSSPAN